MSTSAVGFLLISSGEVGSESPEGIGMMMLTLRHPTPSSSPSPSNRYARDFPSSPSKSVLVRVPLNALEDESPNMLILDKREGGDRSAEEP